jgi:cell wall-associated NlpC family hydrolase
MLTHIRLPRAARAPLVLAGLALASLGGVGAGVAVTMDATSSAPAARVASIPAAAAAVSPVAPPLARPAASTPTQTAAPTPAPRAAVRRPAHRIVHRTTRPSRSANRRAVHRHRRHLGHRHARGRHHAHRHLARRQHAHRHPAHGHHAHRHHAHRHAAVRRHHAPLTTRQRINSVIRVARAQRGKPYVWGAAGPRAFDCSGYVQWVYRHALGIRLPKYTDSQFNALPHIRPGRLRRGDLVFVRHGRHESHVGIYAGGHRWWVAPHTGSRVKLQKIWPAHHVYARVLH